MSTDTAAPAAPAGRDVFGHPRQLWMLFMTEFWERFSFYGMRWALTLYIVAQFFGGDKANGHEAYAGRTLEQVCVRTVESGAMTKDLAVLVGPDQPWQTTEEFMASIEANLAAAVSQR